MNLPPLRDELSLWPAPRAHDGQPTWTIQDPARNRFFRIDWLTFEVLQRWSLGEPELIARHIGEQTPLRALVADVTAVLEFLANNQLLKLAGANNAAEMARIRRGLTPGALLWLVHNYLFFRVPLVRPERFLVWLHGRTRFFFQRWLWQLTAVAGLVGAALVARHWDAFVSHGSRLANVNGWLSFVVVVLGVKVVHELGHGLAATHFGCRVPTMGIAFLVLTPVAYTDINEAWKLVDRRARLWIGAAGMLAEFVLAAWATLAWVVLPDGTLRTLAFILATTTWIKSLVINCSPVMRFDGYYLLSDFLELPNLHARVFALARWRLREWLFQLGDTPPEHFPRRMERGLVALAFFIWLYRLVVFLGIAVFVYYYFFKALGIVLFVVEIGWFVLLPMLAELKVWVGLWPRIRTSARARKLAFLGLALAGLLLVPLPQRIAILGEWRPQHEFRVVAPGPAELVAFGAADGMRVARDQVLLTLTSLQLEHRLASARARETSVREQIQAAESDPGMRPRLLTMQAALAAVEASRREAEVALANLAPRSPFDGVLRLNQCDLRPGEWVQRQEELALVIGDGSWQVVGYVRARDAHLLQPGARAWFSPEGLPERRIAMTVAVVDQDAARTLSRAKLSSTFGGEIPARMVDGALMADESVFRVVLLTEDVPAGLATMARRGHVLIHGQSESLAVRLGRTVAAVLWREAGF